MVSQTFAGASAKWVGRWVRSYPCVPIRRAMSQGRLPWLANMPKWLVERLDLTVDVVAPMRVELGCGHHPTPGYLHVDIDRSSRHIEYVAPVWQLPFEDGSVSEILAVHVFEHIHPALVGKTAIEWKRVLKPGGLARIHVPNVKAIFAAFESCSTAEKWSLVNALYGMYGGPEIARPEDIPASRRSDHQAMYDFDLLESVLLAAGFSRVKDLTGKVRDRHVEAWAPLVDHYSLVVAAYTPEARSPS